MKPSSRRGPDSASGQRSSRTGDQDAREHLILNYSPLVKYVAGRLSANLPQTVENADLISYGIFGLIDAIEKFDPERGIKFETYAIARIKGAIIDELRAMDWVPRSVRARAREIERPTSRSRTSCKRVPTDAEVAGEMGISAQGAPGHLHEAHLHLGRLLRGAVDRRRRPRRAARACIGTIQDETAEDPVAIFESEEIKDILAAAIERLPEREKIVIALYYYEGLTLKEIGEVLGVTESRVSQLHTKAVLRLRARLHSAQGYVPST